MISFSEIKPFFFFFFFWGVGNVLGDRKIQRFLYHFSWFLPFFFSSCVCQFFFSKKDFFHVFFLFSLLPFFSAKLFFFFFFFFFVFVFFAKRGLPRFSFLLLMLLNNKQKNVKRDKVKLDT